jgi:dephospho-CoA kinase
MPIVGLTGGIGSGKSLVASQFASLGVPIVDTDAIARALTEDGMPMVAKIAQLFGASYLNAHLQLNRAKLRQLVFSNHAARLSLEALMHPAIQSVALQQLQQNNHELVHNYQLLVVPLLFETNHYADIISQSLVVDCTTDLQIARVLARPGNTMSVTDIEAVIAIQMSRHGRIAKADLVITNDDTSEVLMLKVQEIHQFLSIHCSKLLKSSI